MQELFTCQESIKKKIMAKGMKCASYVIEWLFLQLMLSHPMNWCLEKNLISKFYIYIFCSISFVDMCQNLKESS